MLKEKNSRDFAHALNNCELFVFDLDGTVYLGGCPFPFAIDFINYLRNAGKKVLFFTNNASHSKDFYMTKLTKLGLAPKRDEILTAGNVTEDFLLRHRPGKKVYLIGNCELYREFKECGISVVNSENGETDCGEADIVVSSFDTELTYRKLELGCAFIRRGAEYLSTHPDYNCPTEDGFIPDSGAIAALITASTGKTPKFFGKPSRETAEAISAISGVSPDKIAIFGDRLYTDIALGKRHGIKSVLVLTGETAEADLAACDECDLPDQVYGSLGDVHRLMCE